MAVSTIPLVIDALKALLEARPGLSGVQVFDGIPTDPEPEWIWIADTNGFQVMATAKGSGGPTRTEEYDLSCIARVQWPLDDVKGARDRVFGFLGEVEQQLRGDASLGVLGPYSGWAQLSGPVIYQPDLSSEQRIARLLFTIHVKARI